MKVLQRPLDAISREARPYPAYLLDGCETGLCLFAAAFLGHNDAIHMARAEMRVTCVDTDGDRLAEMKALYPDEWVFCVEDAFHWARCAADNTFGWLEPPAWDAVSVDPFTGDAMERSLESLDLWCSLAASVVTVGVMSDWEWEAPAGWTGSLFERSHDVSWLVLTR